MLHINHQTLNRKTVLATVLLFISIAYCELIGLNGLGLDKAQQITTFILLISAVLWVFEWVPLFVVSFLILALEIVWLLPALNLEQADLKETVFYGSFFSNIILLFIGGFVLSSLMQKYGLDLKFAQTILRKTKGKPEATLLGIILACSFLSMWISNTATTAMMLTIVFPLLRNMPENHAFRTALILAIPFACNIGGIGTPIGTPPNAIALSYLGQKGLQISFAQWIVFTLPFLVLFLLFLWRLLLTLYPPNGITLEIKVRETSTFGIKHVAAISIFMITALGWFFGNALQLKTGTVALFPIIACFWLRLLGTADFRNLPWDILYIISGGLALGVALNISGLGAVLVNALPLDQSPTVLIILAAVIAGVMSTIMSNTATAGLVIPLVMSLQMDNSFILTLVIALAMMCSMAMALPVTTPPNAIAFSSRAINTRDMIVTGGIITLVGFLMVVLFGNWYWQWAMSILGLL